MINLLLTYAWLSIMAMGLVWIAYRAVLMHDRRHTLHRFVLLGSTALPFLLLGLKSALGSSVEGLLPAIELPAVLISAEGSPAAQAFSWAWLWLVLGGIAALRLALVLARVVHTLALVRRHARTRADGVVWVHAPAQVQVASFFRWVFWREDATLTPEMRAQLRAHELCHVRQGHSWDILWLEILLAVGWFNPFLWLIRREVRTIHEYLADQAALQAGGREAYHRLMLHGFAPGLVPALSHPFLSSTLKKRLTMMKKMQQPMGSALRYALLLPLLALVLGLGMVQAQTAAAPKSETAAPEYDNDPMVLNMPEVYGMIKYPEQAKEEEIQGKVFVQVTFGEKGEYVQHEIKKSAHPLFTQEVERVVPKLKGNAVTSKGKPVKYVVTIPFMFALKK